MLRCNTSPKPWNAETLTGVIGRRDNSLRQGNGYMLSLIYCVRIKMYSILALLEKESVTLWSNN